MHRLLMTLLACHIAAWSKEIPITLEHADQPHTRSWGLMGRTTLDENHGMLLEYDWPVKMSIWMFNVNMDLDIAFIDGKGVIQEIRMLKAYPEMMDPNRPVKTLKDIELYPYNDPIKVFFSNNSIKSSKPARFGLEMKRGWFEKNEVGVGDRLEVKKGTGEAKFITK